MRRVCSISECETVHYGRGYCVRHYRAWYRHDDPLYVRPPKPPKPVPPPWWGRDLGIHRTAPKGGRCGGLLLGIVVKGHRWAVCGKCGLRGLPVEVAS
jgi:hypothetical protein